MKRLGDALIDGLIREEGAIINGLIDNHMDQEMIKEQLERVESIKKSNKHLVIGIDEDERLVLSSNVPTARKRIIYLMKQVKENLLSQDEF